MASELANELLKQILRDFNYNVLHSSEFSRLVGVMQNSTKYSDAEAYAGEVGKALSQALKNVLTPSSLPDGKLYYNIAEDTVIPSLRRAVELINKYSGQVQRNINSSIRIPFKDITPQFDIDRAHNLIDRLTEYVTEGEEQNEWLLDEDVISSFTRSAVDDSIKANAAFEDEAGLTAYIVRSSSGNCCAWCESMVGTFEYGKQPEDFFQVHKDCTCTIELVPSRTKWSRIETFTATGRSRS